MSLSRAVWVLAWTVLLCAGCGGSNPESHIEPEDSIRSFRYLPVADVEAYIAATRKTLPVLNRVRDEFTTIADGWVTERLTLYWARQFMGNLMKRTRNLQGRVEAIRPQAPELLDIHLAYEEAVGTYLKAFGLFLDQLDFASSRSIEDVNATIFRGNFLMERYQLRLSNLRGQRVTL